MARNTNQCIFDECVSSLKENYLEAKKDAEATPAKAMRSLRMALEYLVDIVWILKIGTSFTFPNRPGKRMDLDEAMKYPQFKNFFTTNIYSDMHVVRMIGNDASHKEKSHTITTEVALDTIERFEKCVSQVEAITNLNNLCNTMQKVATPTPKAEAKKPAPVLHDGNKSEREFFYDILRSELNALENPPFYFTNDEKFACINKKRARAPLALILNYLTRERFLRIAIYIENDEKSKVYDRLVAQKDVINSSLGLEPDWRIGDTGKARWIETLLPINADKNNYTESQLRALAKKAIPIIEKYAKTFSVYLPEAF